MNIELKPDSKEYSFEIDGEEFTLANFTSNFTSTYKTCYCKNGKPALRCEDENKETCDKDSCDENFKYDTDSKICVPIDVSLTCQQMEHYVNKTNTCERNVCYCNYGEVTTGKCIEHNSHSCRAVTCNPDTVLSEGKKGFECTKPCEKILFMDSTWKLLKGSTNTFWQLITSEKYNVGYTFFEALNYCQSLGTYVSLPSNPDYFQQLIDQTNSTTWIGLSRFGDLPEKIHGMKPCSSDDELKWERNNQLDYSYLDKDLLNQYSGKSRHCCVEIFMSNDKSTISQRLVDCNKRMNSFICEYSSTNEELQTPMNDYYKDNSLSYIYEDREILRVQDAYNLLLRFRNDGGRAVFDP